jgi:hypothetical protein
LLTPVTVWEHTPLDYYRYGEYPRFLRPVGAHQPRTEWRLVEQPHRRWSGPSIDRSDK